MRIQPAIVTGFGPSMISVRARRTTNQALVDDTVTACIFDMTDIDSGGVPMWDVGDPTKLTFHVPGIWCVGAQLRIANVAAQTFARSSIILNSDSSGLELNTQRSPVLPATDRLFYSYSTIWSFVEGDFVELTAYSASSPPEDVTIRSEQEAGPSLWAFQIS